MNVYDTLAQSARQWPERTAIIDAAGALDYRSLWREIEALRLEFSSASASSRSEKPTPRTVWII